MVVYRWSRRGRASACEKLLELLQSGGTPGHVDKVVADWTEVGDALSGFTER